MSSLANLIMGMEGALLVDMFNGGKPVDGVTDENNNYVASPDTQKELIGVFKDFYNISDQGSVSDPQIMAERQKQFSGDLNSF